MNPNTFRNLSYGVYIVSAWDKGRPCGCTANSVMQITSSPATIAVSLNHDNYTTGRVKDSGHFAVSILAEDSPPILIGGFGFCSARDTDKFAGVESEIVAGLPVLKAGCGYIVCKVVGSMETSTHTVFLGEVIEAEPRPGTPMTYAYYHGVIKGKTAKNAPTYIKE